MKKLLTFIFILNSLIIFAQGEANIWYFGENAGLDFNSGSPIPLTNGQLNTFEGCSSFSDSSGNLLFYSDGTTVWTKDHTIMLGGTGLKGDPSSTQSAMIIPKPGNTSVYYLFTVGSRVSGGDYGFDYYTIDMNTNGGLGSVIAGPFDLSEGRFTDWTEKVAAIKGDECQTFWVISYVKSDFYAYKISTAGVASAPVISTVSYTATDRRGYLKIAPDGKKLAIAHMSNYNNLGQKIAGSLLLYDFNDATGVITNQKNLPLTSPTDKPYGVEFSSNSEKLYVHASNDYYNDIYSEWNNPSNHLSTLYQFNLSSNLTADIIASRKIIDSQNLYRGGLQLGPDQKIYRALSKTYDIGIPYLGVIQNPENDGVACNYLHLAIDLAGNNATQGLPPFIASIFSQIEISNIDTNGTIIILNDQIANLCVSDNFNVTPKTLTGTVTYNWFLNGTPYSNLPNLIFTNVTAADNGLYSLVVTQTDICGNTSILEGEFSIKVSDYPPNVQPTNIEQCDDDNDGFLNFDLNTLKDTELLDGESITEFEVLYYTSQTAADANTDAISIPYTNSTPFSTDTIFTRIHHIENSNCYETNSFTIQVFETPNPPSTITILEKCDNLSVGTDSDGFIIFDVTEKETEILNGQLASNFTISYYSDSAYSAEISNPTAFPNTISGGQTIYVRITNNFNATCSIDTSFELKVNPLPVLLTSEVTLEQCDDDINNDGFSFFNLNEANELISADYQNETFEFYSDAAYTQLITNPIAYQNPTVINSEVFVKISTTNGCERFAKILLKVGATQIPPDFHLDYYACEEYPSNNQDGKTFFDFSDAVQQLIDSKPVFSSQLVRISFFESLDNALSETNAIPDISNYQNANAWNQEIYVRIDSDDVNACLGLNHVITLHVEPLPIANPVTINRECDDDFDGYFPFDISTIEATVLNGQTNVTVSYFDQDNNPLPSPLSNPFLTNSQTITIRVTNNLTNVTDGACFDETKLEFIVEKKPVANVVSDFVACDDDFDGLFNFDTSTIEATVLNGQTGMLVSYFDQDNNPLSPLPNPFLTAAQTITVRVENELYSNCTAETTFDFIVNPKPQFELDETAIYCTNLPPIKVITYNPLGNYTYEWKDETGTVISTNLSATISNSGIYTVIATSNEGCESLPHQIIVEASSIALLTENDITVVDDSDNNSITISTANLGIGDYEYALAKLDGFVSSFQDEPYFDHLAAGIYTVLIQDKNNCGTTQLEVSVIGYPKFFTPNNDGFNDTWNILGINDKFYTSSMVNIFDRFGKLVAQINPNENGWDGLFKGNPLPATDYWFSVELVDTIGNIRTRKGHFSLIRR